MPFLMNDLDRALQIMSKARGWDPMHLMGDIYGPATRSDEGVRQSLPSDSKGPYPTPPNHEHISPPALEGAPRAIRTRNGNPYAGMS